MKITRLTNKEYQLSNWSGGETTQLYLSPPAGAFRVGRFDYRISTATIALEKTIFSELPGYQRLIMPLKQTVTLVHEDEQGNVREKVVLQPFQCHHFEGSQRTTSDGKCTDFNLIYLPEYTGKIALLRTEQPCIIDQGKDYFLYALTRHTLKVFRNNECLQQLTVSTGESIHFSQQTAQYILAAIPEKRTQREPLAVWTTIARTNK